MENGRGVRLFTNNQPPAPSTQISLSFFRFDLLPPQFLFLKNFWYFFWKCTFLVVYCIEIG